jgi:uncharacterized protein YjbJ (UPF0337 family)
MTECKQSEFEFEAHFSRRVVAQFDGQQTSTEGGALLLRATNRKIGMLRRVADCVDPFHTELKLRLGCLQTHWQWKAHSRDPQIKSCQRRDSMKKSTKDKAKGKFHEAKGKVKEKIGRATNNPDLETEGQVEKIGGKAQKKIGQVEKVLDK